MQSRILVFLVTLLFTTFGNAATLITQCVSKSGMSTYNITIDIKNNKGEIRYRFMKQDITYKFAITSNNGSVIEGFAIFDRSRTGETKGNPFSFKYSFKDQTYTEKNIIAKCE